MLAMMTAMMTLPSTKSIKLKIYAGGGWIVDDVQETFKLCELWMMGVEDEKDV